MSGTSRGAGRSEPPPSGRPGTPLVAACAAAVALIGVGGMAGWALDIDFLKQLVPGLATMKANTAAGFVLSGVALWRCRRVPRDRLAAGCAAVVGALAVVTLIEYASGHDLRVDQLLFTDLGPTAPGSAPGRMSAATAAAFVLAAAAVLALDRERPPLAPVSALACGGLASGALVAYAYDAQALYSVEPFSTMALHTAVAFLLLSVGLVLARPDRGVVAFATGVGPGPTLIRRLVPWAVAVPVLTGWLRIAGERAGLYPPEIGTTLLVLTNIALLVAVIAWTARGIAAAEARAAELRLRLSHVVSSSPALLYSLALDGDGPRLQWISDNLERLTGYTQDEAARPGWWRSCLHPDDRDEVTAQSAELLASGALIREYRFRVLDGAYRWIRDEQRLVPTPMGAEREVVGSWTDITKRRSIEEQLLKAQRMESLGRLAGGIAHDFNNILGVVNGYAELLRDRLASDRVLAGWLDEILIASERAATLTGQLLAFSRRQVLQPVVIDLNQVVAGMNVMLERLLGEHIRLRTVVDQRLPSIRADAAQLEQVLMNLAVNARDAMPRGGHLTVETSETLLDDRYAALRPGVQPGHYVVLAVSDSGTGMDAEVLSQIFEPFFTTKEQGRGTGLGLSTVHGIVRQSGGHIYAYSEVGKGSTFKVYLPAIERKPDPASALEEIPAVTGGTETVLVVEDEAALCALVRTGLEASGYTVLAAPHGAAAGEIARSHDGPIDLLLTDVVIPDVGGRELAAALQRARPEMKVLFMSGYTGDAIVVHGILEGRVPFLQKPFTLRGLALKVREVLDRRAAEP